jgi:hypothetical protein
MRKFISSSLLIIVTGVFGGCASGSGTNQPTAPNAQNDQAAAAKTFVMQSGGVNVLKLSAAAAFKGRAEDGSLHLTLPQQYEVEFWIVPGAKTVDEALGRISTQIISEFKDFKPDHTTDITVAGSPAKRLTGKGHEADDGDPGAADVVVFKVGDHVFIACNHGEGLDPAAQQGMLTLLQSAQVP